MRDLVAMGAKMRYSAGKIGMVVNGTRPRADISSRGMVGRVMKSRASVRDR